MIKKFPTLYQFDWTIISKENKTVIINKHTGNQFLHQKIESNSHHLLQIYSARALYTIPNTPQIMLGDNKSDDPWVQIFVQCAPFEFDKLISKNHCKKSIAQIFRNILKTVSFLVNKFGFFRITSKMIRITPSFHYLIWINQNFSANHRQFPIKNRNIHQDYKCMINDLLDIFEIPKHKNLFKELKNKLQSQTLISFQKLTSLVQKQLNCDHLTTQNSKRHYVSPQFIRRKQQNFSNIEACTETQLKDDSCFPNLFSKITVKNQQQQNKQRKHSVSSQQLNKAIVLSKLPSPLKKSISDSSQFQKQKKEEIKKFDLLQSKKKAKVTRYPYFLRKQSTKKDIRGSGGSGNSLATTAAVGMKSVESLSNFQFLMIQNGRQRQSLSLKRKEHERLRLNSLKKEGQKNDRLKLKTSRIILEHNQQPATPLASKQHNNQHELRIKYFTDYQRDFNFVLNYQIQSPPRTQRPSTHYTQLQSDLNNILQV